MALKAMYVVELWFTALSNDSVNVEIHLTNTH